MKKCIYFLILPALSTLLALSLNVLAAEVENKAAEKNEQAQTLTSWQKLSLVVNRYRDAGHVKMDLEKKINSIVQNKEVVHKGELYFGKGKMRLEINSPEKSLVIFDEKFLWIVRPAPPEFPGPTQISRGRVDKNHADQILFVEIMTKGSLSKRYKLSSVSNGKNQIVYKLDAKDPKAQIRKLEIVTDGESKEMLKISYEDEVENKTLLSLSNTEFIKKTNEKLFVYAPEKGAKVNDL